MCPSTVMARIMVDRITDHGRGADVHHIEIEEELFDRQELTSRERLSTVPPQSMAALGSSSNWSAECTGLAIDLMTGNYHFACRAVLPESVGALTRSWELKSISGVSVKNNDFGAAYSELAEPEWVSEAVFAYSIGLAQLRKRIESSLNHTWAKSDEQLRALAIRGFDLAQDYVFFRPAPEPPRL